jgi:ATP-dependent Clp protease ATP-binding subunit ClpX
MTAVYDFITAKAMEYKLGARGLRSICESLFTQAMYELPGTDTKTFNVTLDYAKDMFDKSKINSLKVA